MYFRGCVHFLKYYFIFQTSKNQTRRFFLFGLHAHNFITKNLILMC